MLLGVKDYAAALFFSKKTKKALTQVRPKERRVNAFCCMKLFFMAKIKTKTMSIPQKNTLESLCKEQKAQLPLVQKLHAKNGLEIKGDVCPEQYDVFKDGKQVAYYLLRFGHFRVFYYQPDCASDGIIYETYTYGSGNFYANERLVHLTQAMRKLLEKLSKKTT